MTSYFRIFAVENLKTCWPARESPLTLTGGEVAKERCITKNQITMANRPLAYTLTERKATIGAMAEKIVLQARPTGCKRIDHRSFCDEVVHATTFTGVGCAPPCRWNCETPCGKRRHREIWRYRYAHAILPEQIVEKGKTEFVPDIHITKPVVRLSPSRKYFTFSDVSYERVEAPAKKTKPSSGGTEEEDLPWFYLKAEW